MARVTLSQPGEDVFVGGADVEVFGTNSGGEIITVVTGSIRLDPSFNRGGDTIVLPGSATSYSAYRIGAEVVLTRNDGAVTVRVPFGTAGLEVQFDGGDSRTLLFDGSAGQVTIEGQAVSNSSASPTTLAAAGATPNVSYDVVGANVSTTEGDSGTKLLTFTISLDRAVTGEPLTLNYQTQNGTATVGSDFVAASGTVTIPVGQQSATVAVTINGDTAPEGNETFTLNLSVAQLRNGPETLTGTITNDDFSGSLTASADTRQGSAGNDNFTALNNALGTGDQITDGSTTDNDTLALTVTGATTNRDFAGFSLTNVENVAVTNTSGQAVVLNLSNSTGVKSVTSINSSASVVFNQLISNASVVVSNVSGTTTEVQALYQAGVTAGTSTVASVAVNNSTANQIILGTVGAGNTGIETVNLSVTGVSTINALTTQLTTLNITGGGDITIAQALVNSVRTVNASGAGRVSIDFSNNDVAGAGVTFTGTNGADVVRSGLAADILNTGAGNDTVVDEGGNDSITTGTGNDTINLLGAGDVTIDTGADSDTVTFAAGTFNGTDRVALGDGGDTLVLSQGTGEADYLNVTGAETLTVTLQASTNLGSNGVGGSGGEAAGIRTINLNVAGNGGGNDTLIATDYVAGLTVNLGATEGTDTVQLGAGADVVNTASLDDTDVLSGNAGSDTLNVTDGALNITLASQFSGFEVINLVSDGDGQSASVILSDGNAPTANDTLRVNAGSSAATEVLTFNAAAVTAYSVNVTSGAAGDSINTNNGRSDLVDAGAGADVIVAGGGDSINAGAGADNIQLFGGANVLVAGDDNDSITIGAGAGNNTISAEAGDDTIFVSTSAELTAADVIDGGTNGAFGDTISVIGTFADAQFTSVINIENLSARLGGASTITLAAEAEQSGIRTVNLFDIGADSLDASTYSAGLTVNATGGNDTILTGSGADLINTAVGSNIIDTGAGDDRIRVSGTAELDASDRIAGGAGNDTIELNNSSGRVVGTADLANVSVETFRVLSDGNRGAGIDADSNVLTFTSSQAEVVTGVTPVNVDASALTDGDDSLTVVIGASVLDSDFTFNVAGSSTNTNVDKQNVGTGNIINFAGGSGVDTLRIAGADAGSTVTFNGNGGLDRIVQTGSSAITDAGFTGLTSVEILSADTAINAVLGSQASAAGIVRVDGTASNDALTAGADFSNALLINLGAGDDSANGGIGGDVIVGGLGKDTLAGGAGADTFRYSSVEDSRFLQSAGGLVDGRDVITDFVAGQDKIDLTQLGQVIRFDGDFATTAEAQAAVGSTANDGFLDVAFVRDFGGQSVLLVDVDDNGQLDSNDLQIVLTNPTGTLSAQDVVGAQPAIASFGGESEYGIALQDQFSVIRFTDFPSLHIA